MEFCESLTILFKTLEFFSIRNYMNDFCYDSCLRYETWMEKQNII